MTSAHPHRSFWNRLHYKVVAALFLVVIVPLLGLAAAASYWISGRVEERLESWIANTSHVSQAWLEKSRHDAQLVAQVLAEDVDFRTRLLHDTPLELPPLARQLSGSLDINLIQAYTAAGQRLYSSLPVELVRRGVPPTGHRIVEFVRHNHRLLAVVEIVPLPHTTPAITLVLGRLLDEGYTERMNELTGMENRLYYRDDRRYLNLFATAGQATQLAVLPRASQAQLVKGQPWYSHEAEGGAFRGLYTPLLSETGEVEAILFSGLARGERAGIDDWLTDPLALFAAFALAAIAASLIASAVLHRTVIRPLDELRQAIQAITGQHFNTAVPVRSNDELGDLAQGFNAMAVSLRQARDEQHHRFERDKLTAMGEMAGKLAHEIRNPIGVVTSAAALLMRSEDDPMRRNQLVTMIREEGLRVGQLVQEFLQITRARKPEPTRTDPSAPLEAALSCALATRPDIRVERDYHLGQVTIKADALQLQQAWSGILTNAIQAMGERGGTLTVSAFHDDGDTVVTVEDSGPGIPADILPRLFEPFFTSKPQGTGLGLSIAYALVEQNGGCLQCLPPIHRGARFAMRFPMHKGFEL